MRRAGLALGASLAVAAAAVVACRQVAGINPIVYAGSEAGAAGCSNGRLVVSSMQQLDLLSVAGGFAFTAVTGANTGGDVNIVDCATSSTCSEPKGLLSLSFSDTLAGYASGTQIFYTVQSGTDAGTLHAMAYDGTGDQVLLGGLARPAWVAVSGARTFWVNDDLSGLPATVHCYGCGPSDATWITNLTSTAGIFADANDVYVLADDGSGQATIGLYGCSVQTACGATPRTVIKNITPAALSPVTQFASDGTNVYVSNDATQIIRIDPTGAQLPVAKNVAAVAIAVDPVTGELFYGEDNGTVARVKTDGSATPTTLSSCDPVNPNEIYGVALDDKNVYVLLVGTNLASSVWAVPR